MIKNQFQEVKKIIIIKILKIFYSKIFIYKLLAILKRCVLSLILKESKLSDSWFHSLGQANAKD